MGANSTLRVSREAALTALAKIEHSNLTDDALQERLNDALREGGYTLDETRVVTSGDDWDETRLWDMSDVVARHR